MTDVAQEIDDLYERGVSKVQRVLGDSRSSDAQIAAAERSLQELLSARRNRALDELAEQTAALASLVASLGEVTASVEASPPLQSLAEDVTGIIDDANDLLAGLRDSPTDQG